MTALLPAVMMAISSVNQFEDLGNHDGEHTKGAFIIYVWGWCVWGGGGEGVKILTMGNLSTDVFEPQMATRN